MNGGSSGGGGISSILSGLTSLGFGLAGAYGKKPKIAPWRNLNLGTEASKAVGSNITNFGDIAKLGEQYSKFLTDQQNKLLPGYSDTLAQGEKASNQLLTTGQGLLSGDLPPDVISQIERSDAFQALSGGYAGSGMSRSLTARDLGLTSLDLMKQGASMIGQGGNSAQTFASMANSDIMNPASMFITPQQEGSFAMENQILKQNQLQNKYNVAAAPDPMLVGASGSTGMVMGGIGGLLDSYFGGGMI
jgi:hypothetical protein